MEASTYKMKTESLQNEKIILENNVEDLRTQIKQLKAQFIDLNKNQEMIYKKNSQFIVNQDDEQKMLIQLQD